MSTGINIGDCVVYGGSEICRIAERVNRCFDGVNEISYLRLVPQESDSASYYVPENRAGERIRPLLSRDEIMAVIDEMPSACVRWSEDKGERKQIFGEALKSDDYKQILGIMKGLYDERRKRSICGKQLISSDEKALAAAESLMHKEFAAVLGIPESSVSDFIEKRLELLKGSA